MPLESLSEPIPPSLRPIETQLEAFGAWAAGGGRSGPDVHAVRVAMYRLPLPWRVALTVLYVPDRQPIEARMRRHGLTPRTLRERQLAGLLALRNVMAPKGAR